MYKTKQTSETTIEYGNAIQSVGHWGVAEWVAHINKLEEKLAQVNAKNGKRRRALREAGRSAIVAHHYRKKLEDQVNYWRLEAHHARAKWHETKTRLEQLAHVKIQEINDNAS